MKDINLKEVKEHVYKDLMSEFGGVKISKDNKQYLINRASTIAQQAINNQLFKSALDVDINTKDGIINISLNLSDLQSTE